MGRLSWGEFGRRVGVPRILDVLSSHGVSASFFMPAVCSLIDPDETTRIVDEGHEIGMHGWIHENNSLLDEATERELMLRARDVLETNAGVAPAGFRSANWDLSEATIAIVRELGLEYDSSLMADEECYELLADGEPTGIVEVPVEWLRDDAVYLMFNRQPATRPLAYARRRIHDIQARVRCCVRRGRLVPARHASIRHRLSLEDLDSRQTHRVRTVFRRGLVWHSCGRRALGPRQQSGRPVTRLT